MSKELARRGTNEGLACGVDATDDEQSLEFFIEIIASTEGSVWPQSQVRHQVDV